jgi:hypothetical protein
MTRQSRLTPVAADGWLVLLLNPTLKVIFSSVRPITSLVAAGERYESQSDGEIIGSFDRLVSDSGLLVGFQVWLVESLAKRIMPRVRTTSYLHVGPGPSMAVMLGKTPFAGAVIAGDQSLIGQLFLTAAGEVAIGLDLGELVLNASDLQVIQNAVET